MPRRLDDAIFQQPVWGAGQISVLAEKIRTRTIRAVSVPDLRGKQYGAVIWEVNDREGNRTRVVSAANDGGRWEFFATGEPFEFENVEACTGRRIKDRFTGEMLEYYLSQMNLFPFSDDWITAPVEAELVERLRQDRRGSYARRSSVH
jgi:hypothetical protein